MQMDTQVKTKRWVLHEPYEQASEVASLLYPLRA